MIIIFDHHISSDMMITYDHNTIGGMRDWGIQWCYIIYIYIYIYIRSHFGSRHLIIIVGASPLLDGMGPWAKAYVATGSNFALSCLPHVS